MRRLLAGALLVLVSCGFAPQEDLGTEEIPLRASEREVRLVTRNLYLGAELDPLLQASVDQLPAVARQVLARVQASDFTVRAQRLAEEIAQAQPHLVGLQEVELIQVMQPGAPQPQLVLDYLSLLLAALEAQGQSYRVVEVFSGTDLTAPLGSGFAVRVTDREVLLARADVSTTQESAHAFAANAVVSAAGTMVPLRRGWVEAVVTVGGNSFWVASTHLEVVPLPTLALLQAAQAGELLARFAGQPTILMGDFNSAADGSTTPTHAAVLAAGYSDAWAMSHPGAPGYTCCQDADLRNVPSALTERIDYVFFGAGLDVAKVDARLVGAQPSARIDGLWPSDHAGVFARVRFESGLPQARASSPAEAR